MSLPMQGGRSGGVQFDFPKLKPKLLNLCLRQNSFEPERFTCERATVEHLKSSLLVRVGNGCVQWPMVWPLNGDQPTHGTHLLNSPAEAARFASRRQLIIALNIIELEFVAINLAFGQSSFHSDHVSQTGVAVFCCQGMRPKAIISSDYVQVSALRGSH